MRHMHEATDELYFVIDEKNNSIELTDKGIDLLTGKTDDPTFFVLPDITSQLSELEHIQNEEENRLRKTNCWPTIPSRVNAYIRSTSC